MHRIDTEGNKNGKFYDGDPSGTDIKEATVLDATWLNAVQEEICSVIKKGGGELKKYENKQLLQAIENINKKALNPVNSKLSQIERQISAIKNAIGLENKMASQTIIDRIRNLFLKYGNPGFPMTLVTWSKKKAISLSCLATFI